MEPSFWMSRDWSHIVYVGANGLAHLAFVFDNLEDPSLSLGMRLILLAMLGLATANLMSVFTTHRSRPAFQTVSLIATHVDAAIAALLFLGALVGDFNSKPPSFFNWLLSSRGVARALDFNDPAVAGYIFASYVLVHYAAIHLHPQALVRHTALLQRDHQLNMKDLTHAACDVLFGLIFLGSIPLNLRHSMLVRLAYGALAFANMSVAVSFARRPQSVAGAPQGLFFANVLFLSACLLVGVVSSMAAVPAPGFKLIFAIVLGSILLQRHYLSKR